MDVGTWDFNHNLRNAVCSITKHFFFVKCNCYLSDKIAKLMVSPKFQHRNDNSRKTHVSQPQSLGDNWVSCVMATVRARSLAALTSQFSAISTTYACAAETYWVTSAHGHLFTECPAQLAECQTAHLIPIFWRMTLPFVPSSAQRKKCECILSAFKKALVNGLWFAWIYTLRNSGFRRSQPKS